jgi:hypothetical protein
MVAKAKRISRTPPGSAGSRSQFDEQRILRLQDAEMGPELLGREVRGELRAHEIADDVRGDVEEVHHVHHPGAAGASVMLVGP